MISAFWGQAIAAQLKYEVEIESTSGQHQTNIPVTFGQVFLQGDIPANTIFRAYVSQTGESIPLQTDNKATYPDGSLRHAVFSVALPELKSGDSISVETVPVLEDSSDNSAVDIQDLLNTSFDAVIQLEIDDNDGGGSYHLSARDLITQNDTDTWLKGNIVTEWIVQAPFKNVSNGEIHDHLTGQFNVRYYPTSNNVLVDFIVENTKTYTSNPRNFNYTASLSINGKEVESHTVEHFQKSRWRRQAWSNTEPGIHIRHNISQLIATKSVPSYAPELINGIAANAIAQMEEQWNQEPEARCMLGDYAASCDESDANLRTYNLPRKGIMGHGLILPYMPNTGGRPDIGPLPKWTAMYLLSQDRVMKEIMLTHGNQSGSFPIHHRNDDTRRIVNLQDNPYFTLHIPSAIEDPKTGRKDYPVECQGSDRECKNAYIPDTAHTPSLSYVPYLVTGDQYYQEELAFWVNWAMTKTNPTYRQFGKGIYSSIFQDRGQAWQTRELARAAAFLPDDSPYKNTLNQTLNNNIENYLEIYVEGEPNQYGAMIPNYSYPTASPWMDDFFTWAVNHVVDLGFKEAAPLGQWKGQFPVQRMGIGENNDYCWIFAAAYHIKVAPDQDGPMYQTLNEVFEATDGKEIPYGGGFDSNGLACGSKELANHLNLEQNEMTGYSSASDGFPSNLQPGLAAAVDQEVEGALAAWSRFEGRSVKPDYSNDPTWAIVPRKAINKPKRPRSVIIEQANP